MSKPWGPSDAAKHIAVPSSHDDKYSRGVLGMVTGSAQYPGAAVLGVEAALRTGVGMVRLVADDEVSRFVLAQRPEAVTSAGRVQAWVLGSGMDSENLSDDAMHRLESALAQSVPAVIDAGALELHERASGRAILTPHHRELARLTGIALGEISADPRGAAVASAAALGATVLLKGHSTWVASPTGAVFEARSAPPWLATAGAGDALAGVLGALVATHSRLIEDDPDALARLGATAAVIHGIAAERASAGGPFTIMDLAARLPSVVADLARSAS